MHNIDREISWLLKDKYHGKPKGQFSKDVQRLKNGEPLDYVIGFTEFLGCKIDLSKKPLIPRPETEYWVDKAIEDLRFKIYDLIILDLFSGSGCVGIAILAHAKNSKVTFADSEKKFLDQAKINCKLNGIDKTRYRVVRTDIFANVNGKFDYIFANPPYIPTTRKSKIQKSVLNHEPKEALFGGKDGMRYIRKFLAEAKNFLKSEGKIYMEFDPPQKSKIEALFRKYGYERWDFNKDQYGKWRWAVIQ